MDEENKFPDLLHEKGLVEELMQLIEDSKKQVTVQINSALTLLYWQVGKRVKEYIFQNQRIGYGKQIVVTLLRQLTKDYGRSFEEKNLRRMLQFVEQFPDFEKVVTLSRQLSWSHFIAIFPLKQGEARTYYAQQIALQSWSVRELRRQMELKAYERVVIGNTQLPTAFPDTYNYFKDPYFLNLLGLNADFLEKDLEDAILHDLEQFILELGKGFAFVERQKRMIIDADDYYLDLLFFHRKLNRLVAIELKVGKFNAQYKGQMELYLKWLNKYERQENENAPIGLILCTEASREQIELLEMHKDGIMVAEYWTELPPKNVLEERLHKAVLEAKERAARRRLE
ncbi:MAG: PDDEXK nuclease domain-containing protein [Chitinophagales bacterium]